MRDGVQLSPDLGGVSQRARLQLLQAIQYLRAHGQSRGQLQPTGVTQQGVLSQLRPATLHIEFRLVQAISFLFLEIFPIYVELNYKLCIDKILLNQAFSKSETMPLFFLFCFYLTTPLITRHTIF